MKSIIKLKLFKLSSNSFRIILFVLFVNSTTAQTVTDGFDYPFGNRGYNTNGYPVPIDEKIDPEYNIFYNTFTTTLDPKRGGTNAGSWYNISDVGNFVHASYSGLHPAEDWNYRSGCSDAGQTIYSVANGVVYVLKSTYNSGYKSAGYIMVIKHTTKEGYAYYSIYNHITSYNQTEGNLSTSISDFDVQVGSEVKRGQPIARIAKGNNCNDLDNSHEQPTHLHFEMRDYRFNKNDYWPNARSNGYYTDGSSSSWGSYKTAADIPDDKVSIAVTNMKNAGILDPSDFIDEHRPEFYYICSNLDIYAGTISAPKTINIWFKKKEIANQTDINNVKIGGKSIPYTSLDSINYNSTTGKTSFQIKLTTNLLSSIGITSNNSYDISFNVDGDKHYFYGIKQLYFLDPASLSDIAANDWCREYVYEGINLGLFKGSSSLFGKAEHLTRAAAAKVIVMAGIKLGILDLKPTTANGKFTDVPPYHWAYPYVQTLRNYNYISANQLFYPDEEISAGAFAKLLCETFLITDDEINLHQINNGAGKIGSKISIQSTSFQAYLDRLAKIVVLKDNDINTAKYVQAIADGLGEVPPDRRPTNMIVFDGNNPITRAIMAKVLLNAFQFRQQHGAFGMTGYIEKNNFQGMYYASHGPNVSFYQDYSAPLKTNDISNYIVIGDKFELTANTSGTVDQSVNLNYTIESGQTQDIGFDSEFSNGILCYFYWVANGGQLTDSYPESHKKVRFTAPVVSSPTNFTLYMFVGTGAGKAYHANITITVNPAGTNSPLPTVQAKNISFSNISNNSATASWQRGNGQYCIVACTPAGLSTDNPQSNTLYTGNPNFSAAPIIAPSSNTKVIYTGTGNSVNLTNLNENTTYQIEVYEYSGNTSSNVKYLLLNPAENDVRIPKTPQTAVEFTWDPSPIIAGQNAMFNAQGTNFTNCSWTFNGANISNYQGTTATNVVFATAGTYNVTLTNSNTTTGQSVSITKLVIVESLNYTLADLTLINVISDKNSIVENQSVTISGKEINNGNTYTPGQFTNIKFYFSTDKVLDGTDYYFTGNDFVVPNALATNESYSFSKTITVASNIGIYSGPGDYYILCQADGANAVQERNEANNVTAVPINIAQALPDFSAVSLTTSLSTVSAGQAFTVTATFNNLGPGNATNSWPIVSFFLSTDNQPSIDDIDLSQTINIDNSVNYAGVQRSVSNSNFKIASFVASGNYYLMAAIDYNVYGNHGSAYDNTYEISETNNWIATPITISNPNQPTVPATNLQITNITDNSATLSWTNGNGQNRIVVVGPGYITLPSDGVAYTAYSDYTQGTPYNGGNKVVYNGNGNTVTITGLTKGKDYYFNVYEYNGSGTSTDYLQSSGHMAGSSQVSNSGIATKIILNPQPTNGWYGISDANITGGDFYLKALHFKNNLEGNFCSNEYIYKTRDGGKTWKFNYVENQYPNALFFKNDNGWAAAWSNLYKTNDYGDSWTKQPFISTYPIKSVFFIDNNIGFLTTGSSNDKFGEIFKTTNGGASWTKVKETTNSLLSIYFVNANVGWACGSSGTILKTIDGGASWNFQYSGYSLYLNSLQFFNENVGYCFQYASNLLKTIDGGKTWNPIIIDSQIKLGMFFLDELKGYVYGRNNFYKTTDGGKTWLSSTTDFILDFLACGDENIFYGGGYNGVFKTTTGSQNNFITPSLSSSSICTPANFATNYTISGTFNAGNKFTAHLSDNNGSFDHPLKIGEIQSTANGTIPCNIPSGLPSGSNYKIRIISSNPISIGASILVNLNSTPVVSITEPALCSYLTTAAPITMSGSPSGGSFTINSNAATQFNPATLGVGSHNVAYTYSLNGCSASNSKTVAVSVPQTINISNLNPVTYCAGGNATINYTIQGIYAADNTFTVELSNSSGSFTSPIGIKSVTSNTSGTITCQLPIVAEQGSGYKVRLVSSNPPAISNLSNIFTINAAVTPSISIQSNKTEICTGGTVLFTATALNGGTSPQYQWKINDINAGTNSSGFSTTSLSDNDQVSIQLTSNIACAYPQSILSDPIAITVNPTVTPTVEIFATATTISMGDNVDFMAITDNSGSSPTYQWFINSVDQNTNSPFYSNANLKNNDVVKTTLISNASCASTTNVSSQVTIAVSVSPSLSVSTNTLAIAAPASSAKTFDITSNIAWTMSGNPSWLAVSSLSGSGNSTITLTAQANPGTTARMATLTVSGTGVTAQTLTITQDGAVPVLTVLPTTLTIESFVNSTKTFDLSSNTNWNISCDQNWLLPSITSGSGNATITLTTQANPSVAARNAIITISGTGVTTIIINVTQYSPNYIPQLSINYPSRDLAVDSLYTIIWTGGDPRTSLSIYLKDVNANASELQIANAVPNTGSYSWTCKAGSFGTGLKKFYIENSTRTMWTYGPAFKIYIAPSLKVSTKTLLIAAKAGSTQTFNMTSNIGWTVSSDQNWVTAITTSGSGNATITLTAEVNPGTTARTATVTVLGTGVTAQTITVTQEGALPVLNVSVTALTIAAPANSTNIFDITSNISWSVASDQLWLTLSTVGNIGNSTITLAALANPNTSIRTANVTVSGSGLTMTIKITQDGTTGIPNIPTKDFIIYPNPTTNILYFSSKVDKVKITIIDIHGKVVVNDEINDNQINVSNFQHGEYIIRIVDRNGVLVKKFIRE